MSKLHYIKIFGVSIPPLPYNTVILLYFVGSVKIGAQKTIIVQICRNEEIYMAISLAFALYQRPIFLDLLCCLLSSV